MPDNTQPPRSQPDQSDLSLLDRACDGDDTAARTLMQRHNQGLFRAAWSLLGNAQDAEEALQESYIKAFSRPHHYRGASSYATWMTRIVINEALAMRRNRQRRARLLEARGISVLPEGDDRETPLFSTRPASPEDAAFRSQVSRKIEAALANLDRDFRTVFILRDVQGFSTAEAAFALEIPEATVKTRLLRARRALRAQLAPELVDALGGLFPFAGPRCEALADRVIAQLHNLRKGNSS